MTTNDIFSLMNLVSGGCTLLPGRVPLQPRYQMRRKISVVFLRTRERDPNLLSLLSASCSHSAELEAEVARR